MIISSAATLILLLLVSGIGGAEPLASTSSVGHCKIPGRCSTCTFSSSVPSRVYSSNPGEEDGLEGGGGSKPPSRAPASALTRALSRDLSVPAVLLASFLNLLGFTMTSPIQPSLGRHFGLPLGASFGSLSSAYPLGMMFGVFLWPTLSDVLGRKSVMSLTLAGSGFGLLLQSYGIHHGWTLQQFLACRVLTGTFSGNSPISKAYLADRGSEGKNRDSLGRYLAWKDAASTLAFIAGPALGGFLYQGGKSFSNSTRIAFVIFSSAFGSLLASASVALFVKNIEKDSHNRTFKLKDAKESSVKDTASFTTNPEIVSCPLGRTLWTGVLSVACVSALYHFADSEWPGICSPTI
mmetsp:Transcript_32608/g.74438  ORF Transcript_32608/g.74438 Transcript_32608/m.74438 type:complete len:351 (-) Transcript_32608:2207-3259(-)